MSILRLNFLALLLPFLVHTEDSKLPAKMLSCSSCNFYSGNSLVLSVQFGLSSLRSLRRWFCAVISKDMRTVAFG